MLTSSLRRNIHDRAFQQLQQSLLYALTAYITGNGRIVAFTGYLVYFIYKHNALLRLRHVIVRHLQQTGKDTFNILAYVTGFRQHGCIHDSKRYMQQFGNGTGKQSLTGSGTAHHDDIGLFNLHIIIPRFLQQALIMIVHRYRQETFRIILPDNILIEKILNLYRFRKFFQIQFHSATAFLGIQSLLSNLIGLDSTTIADVAVHPRYKEADLIFRASAETASVLVSFRVCHIYFFV